MLLALKQHPFAALGAVLVAGLLVWGFWPQPVLVETVVAESGPLVVSIEEEGRSRVINRYLIEAPVDGVVERTELNVGDFVEKGQAVMSITPLKSRVLDPRSRAQARASVAAAQAALEAAREKALAATAEQELAMSELNRLKPLRAEGVISQDNFDRALTRSKISAAAKRSANFAVDVARYELEAAESVLGRSANEDAGGDRVIIQSPITGQVLKVVHEDEGPVRTDEPLMEVGDPRALEVEVDVLSADAVKIEPGMAVVFERWGGEQPLTGVVRRVEPVGFTKVSALGVEEQRVLVICDFASPHEDWRRLGDGYRLEAQFILWSQANVLRVPASSLFRHGDGWAVFVVDNKRAQRREVEVGHRNGLSAQILNGLEEGEHVINHPSDEVDDGRRVVLR